MITLGVPRRVYHMAPLLALGGFVVSAVIALPSLPIQLYLSGSKTERAQYAVVTSALAR